MLSGKGVTMYYDLVYTRCRHGVDILRLGQPILSDGFKVFSCSSALYRDNLADLQYIMNSAQKKQSFNEPDFMDDAYLYCVPDTGLNFLSEFHPVPYDLSVSGDFAKRPGMYLNHVITGDFEGVYPFETFHDKNIWTAQENNEAFYYENEPEDIAGREISVSQPQYAFSDIGAFINDGRKELLKKAVAFLMEQLTKPLGERKYLVIKEAASVDVEKWIAAIELAFSPRMASKISFATRMDKFATSNIYYVNTDGSFSQKQQSDSNNSPRLRALVVGVISKDKSNTVRPISDAPYLILDGEKKQMDISVETSNQYYDLISSFDEMHERFVREFLQSFDISSFRLDILELAEAYEILCGKSFGTPYEYAKALNILNQYKFSKSDIICEIYKKVGERLEHFVKSDLKKSLPIINWVGNTAEIVGDSQAKAQLSNIITANAEEVLFKEYKNGGIREFWNGLRGGPFIGDIAGVLSDENNIDEYTSVIRKYDPDDAVSFLNMYCEACDEKIKYEEETAKVVVSSCACACSTRALSNPYADIIAALNNVLGNKALSFLMKSVKTYEPESLDRVAGSIVEGKDSGIGSVDDALLICEALAACEMNNQQLVIMRRYIENTKDSIELEALTEKVAKRDYIDAYAQRQIFELLDEKIIFGDFDSAILAASIQKNRPKDALCVNSAHIAAIDAIKKRKKGEAVKNCLEPFVRQDFPSVSTRFYVVDLTSCLLKADTNEDDQDYIVSFIAKAPDMYRNVYLSGLVEMADRNPDKWDMTVTFIVSYPDERFKGKLLRAFESALSNSGLKKKNMDALGKLISDKSVRKVYQNLVADLVKDKESSVVSKFFGGFRK